MNGSIYTNKLNSQNLEILIPDEAQRNQINKAIFEELCQGLFTKETVSLFQNSIEMLKQREAKCVILGCTEIPLIINTENSALPV